MIKATSRVKMNMPLIHKLTKSQITALEKTGEALHTEVVQAQVMPFDTGNLQNESTFVDYDEAPSGRVTINHSTPYARRLYYHPEYNFSTKENPGARGGWWEPWISGEKKDRPQKIFAAFMRQEAGL